VVSPAAASWRTPNRLGLSAGEAWWFDTRCTQKALETRRQAATATVVIDSRFNGFPDIALGGYVGGILARGRARAEVTLRRPVKLGKPYLIVTGPDESRTLQEGSDVFAIAQDAYVGLEVPQPVGLDASMVATEGYVGHRKHLVPTCFNCGPMRPEGDGLRIFPGSVVGRDLVAAPWTPSPSLADSDGSVKSEFIWSSLDCPTIWALVLQGQPDTEERAVTARLAVELISPVMAGQPHIVMGWKAGESGRTRIAGGAIYSTDGRLLAKARHTLVTTDWGVPMGLNRWQ